MGEELSRGPGLKADALLVLITAFWGVTFVVVKDALNDADAFSFLAMRFAVGGIAASAIARRTLFDRGAWHAGLLLGVLLFVGYAFQTFGLSLTTPSRSAFLTGLAVVLVPFAALLVFRRMPKAPALLGVALAAGGLYLLTGGLSGGGTRLGDGLTVGCAIAFCFHIVLTERFAPGRPVVAMVAWQLWVTALLSALCLPFSQARIHWTGSLLSAILACGIFASALAISLQTWAQRRTTAVRAALIFALEPVFAALLSVGLGRETLGLVEGMGGVLIVLGVVCAEVGGVLVRRVRPSSPPLSQGERV
ncbi:MAG: DMT family transporter [Myxococcota bacterium]